MGVEVDMLRRDPFERLGALLACGQPERNPNRLVHFLDLDDKTKWLEPVC